MVEDDIPRADKVMNLFLQRFRSRAPSAASLCPGRLLNFEEIGLGLMLSSYYHTVWGWGE